METFLTGADAVIQILRTALLSIAVFLRIVSDGQAALILGMRRIADLAKINVLGGLFGTIISIAFVYVLHEDGIIPSIVGGAAIGLRAGRLRALRGAAQLLRLGAAEQLAEPVARRQPAEIGFRLRRGMGIERERGQAGTDIGQRA